MEILNVKNLSFTYPESDTKAIDNISFSVNSGEFVVVCGESGSGKTTLLKMLKREITPHGTRSGEVLYNGENIYNMDERQSARKIGFVFQKPEQQIVTDKVWHELAFGLESLGHNSDFIRLRVGEMANYFGISHMFRSKTQELSGGQKQLMNLASVMAMSPQVLILDEPTSQLDPISANDFITTLKKLNNELGITVIIIEHRLQEVFPIADKVMVLEKGKMIAFDTPKNVCQQLRNHPISVGFPSAVRIWQGAKIGGECPLTVKEGINFINVNFPKRKIETEEPTLDSNIQLELKEVFFRYEKGSKDVLRGTTLKVHKGEHYCLLGGNGSGKTTTLKILAGILKPYRGKVFVKGEKTNRLTTPQFNRLGVALLPQNPETVFLKSSVIEDLRTLCKSKNVPENEWNDRINTLAKQLGISHLLNKHPYDLSGGEVQKCALCKVLLSSSDVLLLDEPTKGIDAYGKESLMKILGDIKSLGVTIFTVTHDVEFASRVADRCGLFFDGEVLSSSSPRGFFSANNFYTTSASRISRDKFENAVTVEDVLSLIGDIENEQKDY